MPSCLDFCAIGGAPLSINVSVMLCQVCQKEQAVVHLSQISYPGAPSERRTERHFCAECADAYYANTPGMNASRKLIQFSDAYRSKLYDSLEASHPEAFDNHDTQACRRSSELMRGFLRERLRKDGIDISGDGFEMLCQDFFGSHIFTTD
jgi:hypothetical protein